MKKIIEFVIVTSLILCTLTGCSSKKDDINGIELTQDFVELFNSIYDAQPGTAGGSEKTTKAAKILIDFANKFGEKFIPDNIQYVTEIFLKDKIAENSDYLENFKTSFEAVLDEAKKISENIETDVYFNKFMNGISNALESIK